MCGIVGFLGINNFSVSQSTLVEMVNRLHHRGPDDNGIWLESNIGLAHARLSIHDLSSAGHQPMLSASGRFVLIFNGEIYNYKSIKAELEKAFHLQFKSHSDTEVLVNAIEVWGIEKALQQLVGMFAFAVWDKKEKSLLLARDRFGEKPLYYGEQNGLFAFASELKALKPLQHQGWKFDVDRSVLASFMRYGYISAPYSIFKNVFKLESGYFLKVDQNGNVINKAYWDMKQVALEQHANQFKGTFDEAVDALEQKLLNTINLQKAADVPIGAFLSGGIDSSTTVALMQKASAQPVKTFSIGFKEKKFNEAPYAKAVADHLGTEHTEVYLSQKEAMQIVPSLPEIYDEPFADASQIPTCLVSKIAKEQVTVAISGDGGDELFGGYHRYFQAPDIWRKFSWMPPSLRALGVHSLSLVPSRLAWGDKKVGDKLRKLQTVLEKAKTPQALYQYLISSEKMPLQLVLAENEGITHHAKPIQCLNFYEEMMLGDALTYLQDDILVKVDRAAMAVSLETRVPFLDHNIFEFAWSLPLDYKIQGNNGKRILKELLYRYVPRALLERPKMGFGIPYGEWLRTGLRDWAENLLSREKIKRQGYLSPDRVQAYWQEHLSGKRNWQSVLWNILMFQAWLDTYQN